MPETTHSVDAFDPDADPRAVRLRTEQGETLLLSPPMDGGPRFLRGASDGAEGPWCEVVELMREEGPDPLSLPLVVGVGLFARLATDEAAQATTFVTGRIASIEVVGRPVAFRRPTDA